MKLGLYYHIPATIGSNSLIKITGLFGVFIDELAKNCETLFLFLHEATLTQQKECDYQLKGSNIKWVNLGIKNPAWSRDLFHFVKLRKYKANFDILDALILRSPTPYGPYLHNYINKKKIVYFIVGDYSDGAKFYRIRNFRDLLAKNYIYRNDYKFSKVLQGANLIVNSDMLLKKYINSSSKILLVRTTTLHNIDFYQRGNTCYKLDIQLLFTGRIEMGKGIFEIIKCVGLLNQRYKDRKFILNIVGWDPDETQKNISDLIKLINELNLNEYVIFHGKKNVGDDLNFYYRMSDIYVLPSYYEGFPRTLWEAMANSLPIVTTPVGGIPFVLQDKINVVFCEPRSTESLLGAIEIVYNNSDLRSKIIKAAYQIATKNTLEIQTKLLIEGVKQFINK